jgi:hypothetical protein
MNGVPLEATATTPVACLHHGGTATLYTGRPAVATHGRASDAEQGSTYSIPLSGIPCMTSGRDGAVIS